MAYGSGLMDVVQSSTAGVAPQFNDGNGTQTGTLCRAWVNFNGVSGSVAIRASFNVSSITYVSAGTYTVNFTNAISDANYSAVFGAQGSTGATNGYLTGKGNNSTVQQTTTSLPVYGVNGNNSNIDLLVCSVAIFR